MIKTMTDIVNHIKKANEATEDYQGFKIDKKEYIKIINIAKAKVSTGRNTINFKLSLAEEKLEELKNTERIDNQC